MQKKKNRNDKKSTADLFFIGNTLKNCSCIESLNIQECIIREVKNF